MKKDFYILQELGKYYAQAMYDPVNEQRRKLHTSVNDLNPIRPIVLINEVPWNEFRQEDELKLSCADPFLRMVERSLRQTLYQWNHFPGDMILPDYFPVPKIIHSSGIGIVVAEHTLATDSENQIVSHEYFDHLETEEQLERLHSPVITYDSDETVRQCDLLSDIFGGTLPVRKQGLEYHVVPWDDIVRYRGATNLLMDLLERPEFMHAIIEKMTTIALDTIHQYEELNLFEPSPISIHCTSALTSDLPNKDFDSDHIRANDVWGRGAAQIFASASPDMHKEFDIDYMKQSLAPFGLNYYGCCEPLHTKIHIVEQIPNLRKISISPWADIDIAAEIIQRKYVLSAKPSPSNVASSQLDLQVIQKELSHLIGACSKNNCSYELILKDISTIGHNPENLSKWEKCAMAMVI